mgnify:CR=1 FL=1
MLAVRIDGESHKPSGLLMMPQTIHIFWLSDAYIFADMCHQRTVWDDLAITEFVGLSSMSEV